MGLDEYGGQEEQSDAGEQDQQARALRKLIDSVVMGEAMRAFMTTPQGTALGNKVEQQLLDALTVLLGCADLTSKNAIAAHFNLRVATSVLQMIEGIIVEGAETRVIVEAHDREMNSGGSNDD